MELQRPCGMADPSLYGECLCAAVASQSRLTAATWNSGSVMFPALELKPRPSRSVYSAEAHLSPALIYMAF